MGSISAFNSLTRRLGINLNRQARLHTGEAKKFRPSPNFCYFQKVPEVFRHHGYRFFFFSREAEEPIHVHIESAEKYAKFWLDPILLAESHGYLSKQLKEIRELIQKHEEEIRRKWDEHVTNHRQS